MQILCCHGCFCAKSDWVAAGGALKDLLVSGELAKCGWVYFLFFMGPGGKGWRNGWLGYDFYVLRFHGYGLLRYGLKILLS
jgi:hypothetical protein